MTHEEHEELVVRAKLRGAESQLASYAMCPDHRDKGMGNRCIVCKFEESARHEVEQAVTQASREIRRLEKIIAERDAALAEAKALAVPQARPTCATCRYFNGFDAGPYGQRTGIQCVHSIMTEAARSTFAHVPLDFGCSLHEPVVARPDRAEAQEDRRE